MHGLQRASLYQVNLRQATPEGRLDSFARHLPRLARMGVGMLWLMPIHPIGLVHRKGTHGSPYAVADHTAVHPDLGTLDDLRALVDEAHRLGLRVILDWVAHHTAWDHPWVPQHPTWYRRNAQGQIESVAFDNGREIERWTDVIGLDYTQPALWAAMTEAMAFWVREVDVDGFRCDVAGLVPRAFWQHARSALQALRPVFLLAEASDPALHERAFDMGYAWDLHDAFGALARGQADATVLDDWLQASAERFPPEALRMLFTSNHDKNAWDGHDAEVYGPEAFAVLTLLSFTLPGMPLVYGGQETWLDRRLPFFEREPVQWREHPLADFYAMLMHLKHDHPALWHGEGAAPVQRLAAGHEGVFAFRRERDGQALSVVANVTAQPQTVALPGTVDPVTLSPWGWHLQVQHAWRH